MYIVVCIIYYSHNYFFKTLETLSYIESDKKTKERNYMCMLKSFFKAVPQIRNTFDEAGKKLIRLSILKKRAFCRILLSAEGSFLAL